jgi:hypothetical protein
LKLSTDQLATLDRAQLERAAALAIWRGDDRTPGFRLVSFLTDAAWLRYNVSGFHKLWLAQHAKRIAKLADEASAELGIDFEGKKPDLARLELLASVEALGSRTKAELETLIRALGVEPEKDKFRLVMQAAKLGVKP